LLNNSNYSSESFISNDIEAEEEFLGSIDKNRCFEEVNVNSHSLNHMNDIYNNRKSSVSEVCTDSDFLCNKNNIFKNTCNHHNAFNKLESFGEFDSIKSHRILNSLKSKPLTHSVLKSRRLLNESK